MTQKTKDSKDRRACLRMAALCRNILRGVRVTPKLSTKFFNDYCWLQSQGKIGGSAPNLGILNKNVCQLKAQELLGKIKAIPFLPRVRKEVAAVVAAPSRPKSPKIRKQLSRKQQYDLYINSWAWKAKREELFRSRPRHCERCSYAGPVDVHHLHYENLGAEPLSDLQILCRECHEREHIVRPKNSFTDKKSYEKWLNSLDTTA